MANRIITPTAVNLAAMAEFINSTKMVRQVNRSYDSKFGKEGNKIGDVIMVRRPQRFISREQRALNIQDIFQSTVPVRLNHPLNIGLQIDDIDLQLSIERLREDIIGPQATQLGNDVDRALCNLYKDVYQCVGTPGTTPNSLATYMKAKRVLHDSSAPPDMRRSMVYNPEMEEIIVPALQTLFNPQPTIAKQYEEGEMYRASGFDWFMSQNIAVHTVGHVTGNPLVNGANQIATQDADGNWTQTVNTDGWTAGTSTLKRGDVIQFTGVNAVNPLSRQNTRRLQDFVVLVDQVADGGGAMAIPVSPPIIVDGAYQTVTAAPADNAPVLVFNVGTANFATITDVDSPQGLAFHRDALTLVMGFLEKPNGLDEASSIADRETGISMRYTRDWDINDGSYKTRLEILHGEAVLRPEWCVRIAA